MNLTRLREMRTGQRARSGNWRADYLETRTVGSEEGGWKRAAREAPRQPPILLEISVPQQAVKSFVENLAVLWISRKRDPIPDACVKVRLCNVERQLKLRVASRQNLTRKRLLHHETSYHMNSTSYRIRESEGLRSSAGSRGWPLVTAKRATPLARRDGEGPGRGKGTPPRCVVTFLSLVLSTLPWWPVRARPELTAAR